MGFLPFIWVEVVSAFCLVKTRVKTCYFDEENSEKLMKKAGVEVKEPCFPSYALRCSVCSYESSSL